MKINTIIYRQLVLILTLGVFIDGFGQVTTEKTIGLSPVLYKKILNQQFTNLITGQSKNILGNFGALDLKEAEVSFAGNTILKNGSVLSLKASGSVSDGLLSLFENSVFNNQVSLEFQYNQLALSKRKLIYYQDTKDLLDQKNREIENQYKIRELDIQYERTKKKLQERLSLLNDLADSLRSAEAAETNQVAKTELQFELSKTLISVDSVSKALANIPAISKAINELENWRGREIKKLDSAIEIYGFNIGWWSAGYKVERNAFKLFDSKSSFALQVLDTNYVSHQAQIQYSKYNWSKGSFESYFWSIGTQFIYMDNFEKLSKVELSEINNYSSIPNERTSTKKYTAYSGSYLQDLKSLRLFGDYYRFLFNDNVAAFHIFPEALYQEKEKPLYNLGLGFLLSFKDDKAAVFNAELYYNFIDIFKSTESGYNLFQRNSIGLRFAFPIKFK